MALEVEIAYVAGVVDSDGCIRVGKQIQHEFMSYAAIVTIQQVEPDPVRLAQELFGGNVVVIKAKNGTARPKIRWTVKSQKAAAALKLMRPHLRIKRPQAENAVRLANIIAESRSARMRGRGGRSGARARTKQSCQIWRRATRNRALSMEQPWRRGTNALMTARDTGARLTIRTNP